MRKIAVTSVVLFALITGSVTTYIVRNENSEHMNRSRDSWQILGEAYLNHDNRTIVHYSHSNNTAIRYYADTLMDLSRRRFEALVGDGKLCYGLMPSSPSSAAAIFQCLSAVGSGLNMANKPKQMYVWRAKTKEFYMKFSRLINKAMKSSDPHGIKDMTFPSIDYIKIWPQQKISVNHNWHRIMLTDGSVKASIGTVHTWMRVDTGSTGIFLSDDVINKLEGKDEIVPLKVISSTRGNASSEFADVFYVPHLKLGPITISNAYVASSNRPYSLFGI